MEEVKEETVSEPIKEVVSEPVKDVKEIVKEETVSEPVKEVVSEPIKEVVSEPVKIEEKPKAVKTSKPKSVKKPVKSKKDSKELKIGGYKITDKHISLFNQIKEACIDLGVSELKRDEARKYKIYYTKLNDGTWGVLREQYKTYMEKFA